MPIETELKLLKRRRTKIMATIGPSSNRPEVIEEMIRAGVDLFRLNMSHGEHESHRQAYQLIRTAAERLNEPVAILADLSGPKIRTGRFEGGSIELVPGSEVTVTTRPLLGRSGLIPSRYDRLADDVKPGDQILLDDGLLELRVEEAWGTEIRCIVVSGGRLSDRKGINLPRVAISAPSLTDKDRVDATFALELGVDFLALSFVRRAEDIRELQRIVLRSGHNVAVIAKIEKPEALEEIDSILETADGIMVARGDLGVELPPQTVPRIQDQLVDLARLHQKPVIVATQMLESMIHEQRPTRAEVSDVSHAVTSGTDAIMLSGETAVGDHPVRAVKMMDAITRQAEARMWQLGAFGAFVLPETGEEVRPLRTAVASATARLSRDLKVRSILVISLSSGRTALTVSAARPAAPVLAVSPRADLLRRMNILWGVVPIAVDESELTDPPALVRGLAHQLELAEPGHYLLLVRGFHVDPAKNAPSITVLCMPQEQARTAD